MPTLPTPGGDNNSWGAELNEFLEVSHRADGKIEIGPNLGLAWFDVGAEAYTSTDFVYSSSSFDGYYSGFNAEATVVGTGEAGPQQAMQGFSTYLADDTTVVNKTITGAANNGSGLIRITATAHTFNTGDRVGVYGVGGTTEANGGWVITRITANTFDLQGSTFSNAYTSGGTATNRGSFYGLVANVAPVLDRGGLTGTAANGDDVAGVAVSNRGTGKGTDAVYIGHDETNFPGGAAEWLTGVAVAANTDTALYLSGSCFYGLAFNGTYGIAAMRLPNLKGINALNAAGSADVALFHCDVNDKLAFTAELKIVDGFDIEIGSTSGSQIGTASTQKLGFFGATPVVQPAANADTSGATLPNLEIEVNQLKALLRSLGLMAT